MPYEHRPDRKMRDEKAIGAVLMDHKPKKVKYKRSIYAKEYKQMKGRCFENGKWLYNTYRSESPAKWVNRENFHCICYSKNE